MKLLPSSPIAMLFWLLLVANASQAQFNIQITVNSGTSTTTCTDVIGAPDPAWSVNIANQGWVTYPAVGGCYSNVPNVQFDQTFQCLNQVPPVIQVCFRAFENDALIFDPCNPVTSCLAETCLDVPVPPQGSQNFTIQLPAGLPSGGSANLTIETSGIPGGVNDAICDALDVGVLLNGMTAGNADSSIFNNYCATNIGDPDPGTFGNFWVNNHGVWFQFTTDNNPSSQIFINAINDPSNFGDEVNLQVGIFTSSDNTCTGTFSFVTQNHDPNDWNEYVTLKCPQPNTTYFILVDGVSDTPDQVDGYFGLEIIESGVERASDLRCGAEHLGTVPLGGTVATPGPRSNTCSSNADAMPAAAFGVQRSVWFSFTPPPTGHVFIEAISDKTVDSIGIQLAAYATSDNTCSGVFSEIYSQHTAADLDETIELHCLDPGLTYYILVDGALNDLNTGIFTLSVSDAGNETPTFNQSPVLCAGGTITVGTNVYSQTGLYQDTLELPGGCDSIVVTDLTVLDEIQVNLQIVQQGIGPGNTNGQALAAPSGGDGSYSIAWTNGQTTALAGGLVGGDNYCVEITDGNGCFQDTCFEMPYYIHFIPEVETDTLNCFGDEDGTIRFTANGGAPPYLYSWQNSLNTLSGSGTITADGQIVTISDLPAGQYSLEISDPIFDTTLLIEVIQPNELVIDDLTLSNVSCFNACDGELSVVMAGGTGTPQFLWSNGEAAPQLAALCAGGYGLTVTDENGCSDSFDFQVTQPAEFIASATETQPVSCFQGSDGMASVSTNGSPSGYLWSNGATTPAIDGLTGGNYSVTVTNIDGCTAATSVAVSTPAAPVSVTIELLNPVVCNGDNNGSVQAVTNGPGNSFEFKWSNGGEAQIINDLGAGSYQVTVTNENGCEATASFTLDEPSELAATFSTNELTCFDAPNDGIIFVEQVTGGIGPYQFSNDGFNFTPSMDLTGYIAGQQSFFVRDAGGCTKEFFATIPGPQEILLELDEDQVIDLGESIRLEVVTNSADLSYEWSPAELLDCPDCAEPYATPVENQLFTLIVTDDFGCTATGDIFIEVNKRRRVYIPNVFSPNGDGLNDEFMPYAGNDVRLVKDFKIFDRQGNMVYSAMNFQPSDAASGWDGRFDGKEMQPGVFVWFAQVEFLDGEVRVFKGDVTLMK